MKKNFQALAVAHNAAFTSAEAFAAGYSAADIRARLLSGEWVVLHRNVYAPRLGADAPLTRLSADILHAGDTARASHLSSAGLQGIETGATSRRRWLTVSAEVVVAPRPGLVVTRSRRMESANAVVRGVPCMSLSRTVVDLAQVLDRSGLTRAVADVIRRTPLTVDHLMAAAEGMGGRAGLRLLRQVLDEFDPLHESGLETELLPLLVKAGFVELVPQYEVWEGGLLLARLDFADLVRREAFEADGWAFHSSEQALARDRRRDSALRAAGWEVTRFLTGQIRREPASVVREAAERRRAADLGRRRVS